MVLELLDITKVAMSPVMSYRDDTSARLPTGANYECYASVYEHTPDTVNFRV